MVAFLISAPKGLFTRSFVLLLLTLSTGNIPLAACQTRPSYHLTPKAKWMNDPQRPFFLNGEWHLYYLWNSNWQMSNPGAGGTEWYHVTSTNLVEWTDRGVAIRKYQPNPDTGVYLGDIETGSAVVDTANTTGFGRNAVVALVTQMGDGIQQSSLFVSTDSGYTFNPITANPVMPNPDRQNKPAFRDPKIFRDDARGRWVRALAEGNKIGFYTSSDLKTWTYTSGFYAIGWMNNWEYANTLPYYGGYQGQQSLVRKVRFRTINGTPTLTSVPIAAYAAKFTKPRSITGAKIITPDPTTASLPSNLPGGAYVIRATVSKTNSDDAKEVRFRIKSDGGRYFTTIGYSRLQLPRRHGVCRQGHRWHCHRRVGTRT